MCWIGIRTGGAGDGRFPGGPALWCGAGLVAVALMAPVAEGRSPSKLLIDTPTAGTQAAASFDTRTRAFPGGGLELRVDIGLVHWLTLGAGYAGMQIIGDGDPEWNPEPGFAAKVQVLPESYVGPAVAVGVDTQGSGYWDGERDRYQYQSRGIYAVLSKNYAWLGDLTFHGGLNRSFEGEDRDLNPFVGLEKSLGPYAGVALEYDAALNDDRDDGVFGRGRGYLNTAVSWDLSSEVQVRFVLRDLLRNSESVDAELSDVVVDEGFGRELTFSYTETF